MICAVAFISLTVFPYLQCTWYATINNTHTDYFFQRSPGGIYINCVSADKTNEGDEDQVIS